MYKNPSDTSDFMVVPFGFKKQAPPPNQKEIVVMEAQLELIGIKHCSYLPDINKIISFTFQ